MFAAIVIETPEQMAFFQNPQGMLYYSAVSGFGYWLNAMVVLFLTGTVFAFVVTTLTYRNPIKGFVYTASGVFEGLRDILMLPFQFRRVYAVAQLSFREAIRRRILFVFVLFTVPFLFAGWYLPNNEEAGLRSLVAFVNIAMTFLVLPLTIFLVSMSLPNDLKRKTIHTIVTKPINRLELIVGRILGFMGVFTLVLTV
ncbi:MAG: hypothetical protein ACRDD1_17985, partial [Planctomycetia bacterium]